jgi:hypothetical protein
LIARRPYDWLVGSRLSQLVIRHNLDQKNRLPGPDLVPRGKKRLLDSPAIQIRAIPAILVDHPAAVWSTLHRKVHGGHPFVFRHGKLRLPDVSTHKYLIVP